MNEAQKKNFDALAEEFVEALEGEYSMAIASIAGIRDGRTLESLTISASAVIKRMKNDTDGEMTVEISSSHKPVINKLRGRAILSDDNQLALDFKTPDSEYAGPEAVND